MDAKANELAKGSTTTISPKPKKVAAHTTTKGIAIKRMLLTIY